MIQQEYQVEFEFNGFLHHGYRLLCPVPGAVRICVRVQRPVTRIYSVGCPNAVGERILGATEIVGKLDPLYFGAQNTLRDKPFEIAVLVFNPKTGVDDVLRVHNAWLVTEPSGEFVAENLSPWEPYVKEEGWKPFKVGEPIFPTNGSPR